MKTKLNLTIDEELVPVCKELARNRGQSLSELVESLLCDLLMTEQPSFSEKWRGRFTAVQEDSIRYQHLKKRFKL